MTAVLHCNKSQIVSFFWIAFNSNLHDFTWILKTLCVRFTGIQSTSKGIQNIQACFELHKVTK